jgi:putative Mn2+ efflux pump MntP
MRALCGAIISAGALIGLGLWSMGVGYRYNQYGYVDMEGHPQWVHFRHLDTSLLIALVTTLIALAIGLGIAFVGLAYHHHRRHLEMLHLHRQSHAPTERPASTSDRVTV